MFAVDGEVGGLVLLGLEVGLEVLLFFLDAVQLLHLPAGIEPETQAQHDAAKDNDGAGLGEVRPNADVAELEALQLLSHFRDVELHWAAPVVPGLVRSVICLMSSTIRLAR